MYWCCYSGREPVAGRVTLVTVGLSEEGPGMSIVEGCTAGQGTDLLSYSHSRVHPGTQGHHYIILGLKYKGVLI